MKRFKNLGKFKSVKTIITKALAAILIAGVVFSDSAIIALAETTQIESSQETEAEKIETVEAEVEEAVTEEIETEAENVEVEEAKKEEIEAIETETEEIEMVEAEPAEAEPEETENLPEEEPEMQMAPVRGVRMMLGAAPYPEVMTLTPSNGDIINFSDILEAANTTTTKIVVNISANGSYTFEGENKRSDGVYADVQINVPAGVEADITFNGCHIINDDGESGGFYSITPENAVTPLNIAGTAKIHVQADSYIEATYLFFTGAGTVWFVDSVGEATLTFQLSKIVQDFFGNPWVEEKIVILHFQGAKVIFKGETAEGYRYSGDMQFCAVRGFDNAKLYVEESNSVQFVNVKIDYVDVYLSSFPVPFEVGEHSCFRDLDGNEYHKYVVYNGNGPDADIVQIGHKKYTDLRLPKDQNYEGTDVYVPFEAEYIYVVFDGSDNVVACKIEDGECPTSEWYRMASHLVKFIDDADKSTVLDSFHVYEGGKVIFPEEDDNYVYTYTYNSNPLDRDASVTSDMDIYVSKVEKARVSITIDGVTKLIKYGAALSTVGADKYLVDSSTGKLYRPTDVITEPVALITLSLTTKTEDSKEWFVLNTAADMTAFAKIVNNGSNNVNGYLNANVTLPSDFVMIGCYDSRFTGTFNGNNHTITLSINSSNEVGALFAYISGGATIKNVITEGSVSAVSFAAGLVGSVESKSNADVTIEKCINNADVSTTNEDQSILNAAAGLVAYISGESGKSVVINNCGNTGHIVCLNDSGYEQYSMAAGIMADAALLNISIKISNCFNTDNSFLTRFCSNCPNSYSLKIYGTGYGVLKDAAAFASGEVTYLLNGGSENPVWHQTCGTGYPSTTGTAVVYAGYADCETTTVSYSNSVNPHTTQGHEDKGEYSYTNGKIVAKCAFCSTDIVAELSNTSENLGSQGGITVSKSTLWVNAECPDVTIKYETEEAGVFSETIPSQIGSWAIKAYVAGNELSIDDITYTVCEPAAPDSGYDAYVNNVIDQIGAFVNQTDAENKEVKVVEYNEGAIPASIILALKESKGVVLHYTTTYMGQEFDFMITPETAKLVSADVQWCGPLYVKYLVDLSGTAYNNDEVHYIVSKGDTLSRIAKKFGIKLKKLLESNPFLKKSKHIFPGQDIRIVR